MAINVSKSRIAVAVVLLLALTTPLQAAAPKAGAKCTKVGSTATAAGKKFTCIKSGTKLVWNKGVAIKAAAPTPAATPTPETKVEVKNLLATDSRITPSSALTGIEICKTEDMTPDYLEGGATHHRNGFPRPANSSNGKNSAKILVIPLGFNDRPFTSEKAQVRTNQPTDLEVLEAVIPEIKQVFKKISADRFDIKIDVLPKAEWWIFDQKSPLESGWGVNSFPKIMELIEVHKPTFNLDLYDTYVFLTGNDITGPYGSISGQAGFGEKKGKGQVGTFNAALLVSGWGSTGVWVHELGHSLFAFEDLYLFNQNSETSRSIEIEVPLRWDLMADAFRGNFIEWNKFLMGWIYDSEVRCLTDQKSSIHYLSTSDTSKDSKLLTINLAPGVTLGGESRISTPNSSGLLLYTVNTNISHGQGPILAQKSLVLKGESKSWQGWQFNVLDSNSEGILFEAIKTDIDKFVPPAPKPKPTNGPAPTAKIQVSKGDILPNGFLKGKATWDVKGHKSYRLYVTAVDDFQKVYFESGFVNDDRSPLVIDISGLVCNKELRTMTEFFSEKDGKGERLVIESKQLSFLSCEDTTKKP